MLLSTDSLENVWIADDCTDLLRMEKYISHPEAGNLKD